MSIAGESEAENAAFEIVAELLLDEARHGPLGGFPPCEPALEVCLVWLLVKACRS